jgi:hypothetical protein
MTGKINIIGFAGRMQSGKDTTARMVQYITSGEETKDFLFTDLSNSEDEWILSKNSCWEVKKFAGKLKEIASLLTGVSMSSFESQSFKQKSMGPDWDNMTYRLFLQKLGTEAIRNGLHSETWVNALYADYMSFKNKWLVTDCRFPNEAKSIQKRNGIIVNIVNDRLPILDKTIAHPSEFALENYPFDYTIDNSGSFEDLQEQVEKMLDHFNIPKFCLES